MYPFAKIQIIPSFDPRKAEASDAFEKISSSISKYYRAAYHREGENSHGKSETLESQASSIAFNTKEYRRRAAATGKDNKLDKFRL